MSNVTIHRCPHDNKNPYVMINNNLIRDKSLSPECRWLLIYLLSNEEGWEIYVSQLRIHLEGFWGRDKIYNVINEAIDAGYMIQEDYSSDNLKRKRYLISETPKFKKCFPRPENQDPEIQDPEKTEAGSLYIKKDQDKEYISPLISPLLQPSPKKVPDKPSPLARQVVEYLKNKILEVNPNFSEPTDKWAKICEEMLKTKSIDHIKSLIHWTFNNEFWKTIIVSPKCLKKNIAKIEAKMEQEKCSKTQTQKKKYASEKNNYAEEPTHSSANISALDIQKLRSEFPEVFGSLKKLPNL